MGAQLERERITVGDLESSPGRPSEEPQGTIRARASNLTATVVGGDEVPLAIDELPLVALAGCFAEGETAIRDAAELRRKESDRIATVCEGLTALGADVEANEDGMVVRGTGGLRGGTLEARGDHRLALLGAVAGLASREGVTVRGFEAAEVSYPGFERDLSALTSR
jgi:3-phosphoshikimate 1-carboxyvinyltransferase